ncbi:oligosaccharide flippase family protein [Aeromonas caviae]|uniref:oligosaccharide flippase family protein n=1 Tax=Aeromonas caviae TaxID=648 RepID=UPI003F749DA7
MKSNLVKYIGSNLLIKAFVFLSQLLVAFFITAEELGLVKTSQAFIEVLSLFACIGLNASILATAPKLRMLYEREQLYSKVITQTAINSILVIASVVIILFIFASNNASSQPILFWLLPLVSFTAITTQLVSFLQCEKKFATLAKGQFIAKLFSVPILIGLTYGFGLIGYIAALYLASFITIAIIYNKIGFKLTLNLFSLNTFKKQWSIAYGAFLSNVLGTCGFYAGLFITNIVISEPNLIGNYSFALIIISGFEVISRSIQQYHIPHFAENPDCNLNILEKKYLRLSIFVALPVLSMAVLIATIYPEFKYNDALTPLAILVLAWCFSFKYTLKSGYFIATGNTILNFKTSIVNVSLTVVLSALLGFKFGIIGIAIARLLASAVLIFTYEKLYENCKY